MLVLSTNQGCFEQSSFVSLPFSQSQNLLMNCLLYHEAGHFIYEEKAIKEDIPFSKILQTVQAEFAISPTDYRFPWLTEQVATWFEEVFADLVGAKLLGPAYSIAAFEWTGMVSKEKYQWLTFGLHHPPDALRFRAQMDALCGSQERRITGDGWPRDTPGLESLRDRIVFTDADLRPPPEDAGMVKLWQGLMRIFCSFVPRAHQLVDEHVAPWGGTYGTYRETYNEIGACLSRGIVPSTLTGQNRPALADPLAVINTAVIQRAKHMDGLLKRMRNTERGRRTVSDRSFLETRLEQWAMKAVEDWLLTRKRAGNIEWPS
jgi:hypothetical protein